MVDLKFILFLALCAIILAAFVLIIYHLIAGQSSIASPDVEDLGSSLEISNVLLLPPPRAFGKGEGMVYGGETVCPVCLSEFREGEAVRQLPDCMHYYHVPCIDMWFRSHSSCPVCRMDQATPVHHPLPRHFRRAAGVAVPDAPGAPSSIAEL